MQYTEEQLQAELAELQVYGDSPVGWDVNLPANELVDEYGKVVQRDDFGEPDPRVPQIRAYDNPEVKALREKLRTHNGIHNLEICTPDQAERAATIFRRDGFVVVKDLFEPELLNEFRATCNRALQQILSHRGENGRKYVAETGRLPHRYCYGTCSASRHMMHEPVWAKLIDMPTTTPILKAIFGTDDYLVWGGGGDLSLPGAIEYQHLHTDGIDAQTPSRKRLEASRMKGIDVPEGAEFGDLDFRTQRLVMDMTNTGVTINFTLTELTWENGPIRQIPGTHTATRPPPTPEEEPEWMRMSTLVGAPAGSGIFRDSRCWHGATPNLSREVRALPSVEYSAGWSDGRGFAKSMPYEIWQSLSSHGQRITRYIHQEPDVWPPGAGVLHPLVSGRQEAFSSGAGERGNTRKVWTDPRSAGTAIRLFNEYA